LAVVQTDLAEFAAKLSPEGRGVGEHLGRVGQQRDLHSPVRFPVRTPLVRDQPKLRVSRESVSSVLGWRSDGKKLWYVTPDLKIIGVELTAEPTFQASEPKVLFGGAVGHEGAVDRLPAAP
jgi:hypothetical protein